MHRYDLGVVCIALGGVYLFYKGATFAAVSVLQLFYTPAGLFDMSIAMGPSLAAFAVGASLLRGRYAIAASLFGRPTQPSESSGPAHLSLENIVTLAGLLLFTSGLVYLAHVSTDWVLTNLTAAPDRHPADVWPYRASAIVEFALGYVLLFHAPRVTAWLGAQQRARRVATD